MSFYTRTVRVLTLSGLLLAVAIAGFPAVAKADTPTAAVTAPTSTTGASTSVSAERVRVLHEAAKHRGVPYSYGGTTSRGFDCSGFTQHVYAHLGITLPRTAQEQYDAVTHIPKKQALPGDLVFMGPATGISHVGIYAGPGIMWDSPHRGARVSLRRIWTSNYRVGRVIVATDGLLNAAGSTPVPAVL